MKVGKVSHYAMINKAECINLSAQKTKIAINQSELKAMVVFKRERETIDFIV